MSPQSAKRQSPPTPYHGGRFLQVLCLLLKASLLLVSMHSVSQAMELNVREARSSDGIRISYLQGGRGAVTIVFIHGWTCDRSYWDAQLPVFAEDFQVIALDLAGHGDSALGRENYSMERFGADVAAVARGEGPVILVGHSMGGPVMLEAARLLGDQVKGLVGVDTLRDTASPVTSEEEVASRMAPLRADYVGTATQFLNAMFVPSSDSALREAIIADMLATDPEVGIGASRGMLGMDLRTALESVEAPLVLINSDYRPTNLPAVRRHHPDTTLYTMGDVGHFVMMEDVSTFNALLERAVGDFLARLDARE
jgi:pimeloyl-ACP methyl ester carboxylesterase